ncbi:hypothetical protein ACIA7S_28605 [Streptomyces sp. NPDC051643]|uniref:hypothetical protein n=1 Tax=Streptomyces sp. NPDC051643 TaxID=3365665 RepID=UPI0037BAE9C3
MNQRTVRTAPVTPGAVPTTVLWAFRDRLHRVDGHRIWLGAADKGTTPVLYVDDVRYPARPLAWVLHHDTPPVGLVKAGCRRPLCIHGPHLTDDVTRQRERILYAALHGITLAGPCRTGRHDLAAYGYARPDATTNCRGCDNVRRRITDRSEEYAA